MKDWKDIRIADSRFLSMKRLLLTSFASLVCAFFLDAQTYDSIVSHPELYFYSESEGGTLSDADNLALAGLSEQIIVHVSSAIRNERSDSERNFNSLVQTYSNTTLPNCRRLILENGPKKYRVLRYIETSELRKVFKNRENKILSMIEVARKAENEMKLDQALKYYYWALCLTESLIYPSSLKCFDDDGVEQVAQVWLPLKIQGILRDLKVVFDGFVDEEKIDGRLSITYFGKPVASLDYSYFDGVAWSALNSAHDGMGVIELRANTEISKINFKIEYTYECEAHIDNEVQQVLDLLDGRNFKEAFKNVPLKTITASRKPSCDEVNTEMSSEYSVRKEELCRVMEAIRRREYSFVSELFTPEGYEQFSRLVAYGRARVLSEPVFKSVNIGDEVYFRSVPMQFSFANNQKVFIENVVFSMNGEGKIDGLNFALEQQTIDDILKKSKWDDYRKAVLINFLESYKTAFALKRLDYISSIFSDDALIIVGQVVKPVALENQILGSEQVIYHRYTKGEYLKKVKLSFESKDYINVKFANLDIYKMGKGDNIFCIQIKQDYCSSNYGDTGYLCLLLDLGDPQKPIIHVRTWQPKPDENFGIFGPGDF